MIFHFCVIVKCLFGLLSHANSFIRNITRVNVLPCTERIFPKKVNSIGRTVSRLNHSCAAAAITQLHVLLQWESINKQLTT